MNLNKVSQRETDTHIYFLGGPLSQWYMNAFHESMENTPNSQRFMFNCAEHYMMARKAYLFQDYETFGKILNSTIPWEQKRLGRLVKNFDLDIWNLHARDIVARGNYAKFISNHELLRYLIKTGDKILVEGASYDRIWGVGLSWDDPDIVDESKWLGTNWLGECLMKVRYFLRNNSTGTFPWTFNDWK